MTTQVEFEGSGRAPTAPRHLGAHVRGWRDVDVANAFEVRNPADTRECVALAARSSSDLVGEALKAAASAAPGWARTPAPERGAILTRAADLMEDRAEEIATAMTLEMGKVIAESRVETRRSIEFLRYFAQAPKLQSGATFPLSSCEEVAFTIRAPLGVVALITPWNFPLSIPVWKTAAALAFGNVVVLKPAELSPLSAVGMTECLLDAGLPPSALNLLPGQDLRSVRF